MSFLGSSMKYGTLFVILTRRSFVESSYPSLNLSYNLCMPTSSNLLVKNFSVLFPPSYNIKGGKIGIGVIEDIVRYYLNVKIASWPSSSWKSVISYSLTSFILTEI